MKRVIIQRENWGVGTLKNRLTGDKCCLGFACAAYGVPQEKLEGFGVPGNLDTDTQEKYHLPKWMLGVFPNYNDDPFDVDEAVHFNDSNSMSMIDKEKALIPLFRKHRIELVFRGKRH